MSYSNLRVQKDNGVTTVTIDNPPVNVLGLALMGELMSLLTALREDDTTSVIVFQSADPDIFLAHVDMTLVDSLADGVPAGDDGLNVFQRLGETLRTQPQVTIVKLAGVARGGGAEFVAAADMTFAAAGRAGLGQVEALMGITPGGGGTQYLLDRVGRNRALEVILGADLMDAGTAERYGWINRALPAGELDAFVDRLAHNIARLAPRVIAAAKQAVPAPDLTDGMLRENRAAQLLVLPTAVRLIRGGLAAGAQTKAGELRLEELMRAVP
jgi:enoyl-CoA hydratase/carnithine racemase